MKARTLLIGTAFVLGVTGARAQWVVTDPGNLAQSIINMSDNIAHTSKTAVNTAESFAETVKIYEQAKKSYCVVQTLERRFYGCFRLKLGVISPDEKLG